MRTFAKVLVITILFFMQHAFAGDMEAAVRDFFRSRFQVPDSLLRVQMLRLPTANRLPKGYDRLVCYSQSNARRLGYQTLWLTFYRQGRILARLPISVEVEIRARVLVLREAIGFRKPITSDAVLVQQQWIKDTQIFEQRIEQPQMLSRMESSHYLPAGKVLLKNDLQPLSLINPGDFVQIEWRGSNFRIQSEGIACSAAGYGEEIRVKNKATGKKFWGTVLSPEKVVINLEKRP